MSLTLAEGSAVALVLAAEGLDGADDADTFLVAIGTNHRLWLALTGLAGRHAWEVIDQRMTDFVVSMSYKAGRGIPDEHVEALIAINRDVASWLTAGGDLAPIRRRAESVWAESGQGRGLRLMEWLISEIERRWRSGQKDLPKIGDPA